MIAHIYNRGVDKRKVFLKESDYERFLNYLYLCNSKKSIRYDNVYRYNKSKEDLFNFPITDKLVEIGAWCLMPNHFHILVNFDDEKDLSKFMQKVTTAYTMFFNKKYKRTGALFAGTYKLKFVEEEKYYEVLWNYIHLNPLEMFPGNNGDILEKYKYSSMLEFINNKNNATEKRPEIQILSLKNFPDIKFSNWKKMKELSSQFETEEG